MSATPRMTTPTQAVLRSLLDAYREHPAHELYGLELCEQLGLGFRTVYRILTRLHNAGWINRRAEGTDAVAANRAARIYYRLTEQGADSARQALTEAAAHSAGEKHDRRWQSGPGCATASRPRRGNNRPPAPPIAAATNRVIY
ncbi:PadR family transcriptional regulator [Actinoplanes sp. KI2]|uniref:PadR family transcriptional regulator n=1 Tax=Actinoplanes sp. KI2 TaxID=2983315 RepID=UPI0021D61293|nr:PadR family transcriptional regulator [Actinoplanes sp. KI2]MCU7729457.1 PadR family transcriptional regulator [Actinoplanes sp. KI2]